MGVAENLSFVKNSELLVADVREKEIIQNRSITLVKIWLGSATGFVIDFVNRNSGMQTFHLKAVEENTEDSTLINL